MHRQTAQTICRLGFVLLCVLPTAAVAGWIVQRSLPGAVLSARQEWEQELSRQLGLRVTCSAVKYPRPDTAELAHVSLADAETGELVANAATLEVTRDSDRWKIVGWQVVVESAQLPLLRDQFERCCLRRPALAGEQLPWEIWFREITFRDAAKSLTLVDVAGQWQLAAAGPSCQLSFRLPEADSQAPRAQLTVERNRQTTPPSTRWQLVSGATPVPCSLASPAWPMVRQLGASAEFAGQLDVVLAGEEADARLRGAITGLDFDALVSEQFAHQLSGLAACQIEDAVLERNRLRLVRGTLKCRDGSISRSLLRAAGEHLALSTPAEVPGNSLAPVPFRQLSLGFELHEESIRLSGSADPLRDHVLIATAAGSLLEVPQGHRASSWGLLRALAPSSESALPVTRQTQALARLLQAPEKGAAAIARQGNHVPTRLQQGGDLQRAPVRQPQLR